MGEVGGSGMAFPPWHHHMHSYSEVIAMKNLRIKHYGQREIVTDVLKTKITDCNNCVAIFLNHVTLEPHIKHLQGSKMLQLDSD